MLSTVLAFHVLCTSPLTNGREFNCGFSYVNKIRDDVWAAYVYVKSWKALNFFTFTQGVPTSSLNLFTHVKPVQFTPVRT